MDTLCQTNQFNKTGRMFCEFCGKPVFANAAVCVHCGRQVRELQTPIAVTPPKEVKRISWHTGQMIGLFVLTVFFFPPFGFYFGCVGLKEPGKEGQRRFLLVLAGAITLFYLYLFRDVLAPPLAPVTPP